MTRRSRTALVVEDDPPSLELVTDVLIQAGWEVRTAISGELGLASATADPPDLVLLDLGLPGIDGQATMRELRREPRTRLLPIIALTAQAMAGDAEHALNAGFDGYLTKPIEIRRLAIQVDEILAGLRR